jgi:plasmid maintenance system antidote protein VapI
LDPKEVKNPLLAKNARNGAPGADTAIRLGKYFGLAAQFWLNLQNDYDLRIAQGNGIGRGIKPHNVSYRPSSRPAL